MTLIEKLINEHNQVVQYAEESLEKDGFLSGMKKAIDIVKNHDGWISVDDESISLPTHHQVIVYLHNKKNSNKSIVTTERYVGFANFPKSHVFSWGLTNTEYEVTHWQPLPEPPKE